MRHILIAICAVSMTLIGSGVASASEDAIQAAGNCESSTQDLQFLSSDDVQAPDALCGSGLCCSLSYVSGATYCQSGTQWAYCCPSGYAINGSVCVASCPSGRSCGWGFVQGSFACNGGACTIIYCCPSGKTYKSTGCQ